MIQPGTWPIEPHIAHNAYVEIAAEMGIPVFAVFVALLVSTFRSLARTRRRAVAYGQESLAAIALAMQAGLMGACVADIFRKRSVRETPMAVPFVLDVFAFLFVETTQNRTNRASSGVTRLRQ